MSVLSGRSYPLQGEMDWCKLPSLPVGRVIIPGDALKESPGASVAACIIAKSLRRCLKRVAGYDNPAYRGTGINWQTLFHLKRWMSKILFHATTQRIRF